MTPDLSRYDPVWRAAEPYMRARKNDVHIPLSFGWAVRLLDHFPQADRDVCLLAILLHDIGWWAIDMDEILAEGFRGENILQSDVRYRHEAEGVRLHALLPGSLPLVMLDGGTFRQALLNLIVNARQAMPGGGELIVELRREGPRAELTITDSGVGMSPDQLERCFDLYFSTKRNGTGLGLAISRHFCRMMGGDITVTSRPGAGSTFTITLPRECVQVESAQ